MAYTKEESVEWAIEKMMEATTQKEINKLNDWAYERAKGSNVRKARLKEGYDAALARIA